MSNVLLEAVEKGGEGTWLIQYWLRNNGNIEGNDGREETQFEEQYGHLNLKIVEHDFRYREVEGEIDCSWILEISGKLYRLIGFHDSWGNDYLDLETMKEVRQVEKLMKVWEEV